MSNSPDNFPPLTCPMDGGALVADAAALVCAYDIGDDRLEVGRYENVGKSVEKRREGKIITGRRCEFFGPNLVGATLDGHCANLRQIRFAIVIARGR